MADEIAGAEQVACAARDVAVAWTQMHRSGQGDGRLLAQSIADLDASVQALVEQAWLALSADGDPYSNSSLRLDLMRTEIAMIRRLA